MKTPLLVGLSWKKQFGNLACHRYHHLSKCVAEYGNKQMLSNKPMKHFKIYSPANQNKEYGFQGFLNNPYKWKICVASHNVNTTDCKSYTTCKKQFLKQQKATLTESMSLCCNSTTFSLLHSVSLQSCTSRFSSSSAVQYEPCYVFKYIIQARVLSRLKIYQTFATVMAIPPTVYLHSAGKLSTEDMFAMFTITSLACVMLYVMSLYFRKIVGMISVCKEDKIVRLSHLTFWGKRRDLYLSPEDIVPLLDMSESAKKIYVLVKTYSSDETFIMFLKFHKLLKKDQLEEIFGPLE